jgi:hypothetical protein
METVMLPKVLAIINCLWGEMGEEYVYQWPENKKAL